MNMFKHCFVAALVFVCTASGLFAQGKPKIVKVTVNPPEAAIYVNNELAGYGYAEFTRPKGRNGVTVIRMEAAEYLPVTTKYYADDKRASISFTLQQDGFFRASAASGIVNRYFTIQIDSTYYKIEGNKVNVDAAWKLAHQILLNYFNEIQMTDYHGGYIQTPWKYKDFAATEKSIRNRVTIRDISTIDNVAFQIKIDSEVAGSMAARHGEYETVDRIPKELEPIIQELQTRLGKVSSL